ncbi:uncharacterized protein LOC108480216 [Gossypium arboreum]|uniref:uncharacterized protein LOC108480216 n=1 Tax=Gossypium arboreum TaxID=29729 RepID=UPI0008192A9B|nr:uncharacterized protein LOC108480216 [Gossypium arboreum]
MSTRSTRVRGTRGHGRGHRGAQAESLASDTISNLDTSKTPVSPVIEIGSRSHDHAAGDDELSQAMLQILERVAGHNTRSGDRGLVTERLRSNGAELFRGVTGVAPNVAEYSMEATERIMDNLDFTAEQKLKRTVSLLRDEAYQGWLTVKDGTQPDQFTWDYFETTFQGKYVGASYIDARRLATEYERCVRFEDGLKDNLQVLIAPQREHDFSVLIEKVKIAEEGKRAEHQNREKGKNKRELEPSTTAMRHKKKARSDGLVRVGPLAIPSRVALCGHCGRLHLGECWRTTGACLRCGSTEHLVRDCPLRTDQM